MEPSVEFPQTPPQLDVPLWSENYVFQGGSEESGIFFYHLIGRVADHPQYWRSLFNCTLPNGDILSWRTYGTGGDQWGPRTDSFAATCVVPLSRWNVSYRGVAARTTREQNRSAYLSPWVRPVPIEFEVMWDGTCPVWDLAEGLEGSQPWCDRHYEQAGMVRGHLRCQGETFSFSGPGYRDHSVGPRDLSTGSSHTWVQAQFPDGTHVGVIMMSFTNESADRLLTGYVVDNGEISSAEIIKFPEWGAGAPHYDEDTFEVSLNSGSRVIDVRGRVLDPSFYFTLDAPSELIPGYNPDDLNHPNPWPTREAMCTFEFDGQVGQGFLEVSRRQA